MTCKTCKWWLPMAGAYGQCHGQAPAPVLNANLQYVQTAEAMHVRWPLTLSSEFCRLYEQSGNSIAPQKVSLPLTDDMRG